jgi:hypothetical protein
MKYQKQRQTTNIFGGRSEREKKNNHAKHFIRPCHMLHREERGRDGSSNDTVEK